MKTKLMIWSLLLAATVGLGVLLAQDQGHQALGESTAAKLVEQNQQILDNQKKTLERLDKMQEDIQFIKLKTGKF